MTNVLITRINSATALDREDLLHKGCPLSSSPACGDPLGTCSPPTRDVGAGRVPARWDRVTWDCTMKAGTAWDACLGPRTLQKTISESNNSATVGVAFT